MPTLNTLSGALEPTPLAQLVFHVEEVAEQPGEEVAAKISWDELALGREADLQWEIGQAAAAFFGPRVSVDVTVSPVGSVEVAILLMALGQLDMFRKHTENIEWFASQVVRIIRRVFAFRPHDRVRVTPTEIAVADTPPDPDRQEAPTPRGLGTASWLQIIAIELAILVGLAIALLTIYATR